ncbi:MAG: diguanylate cyclase [Victivallales bacterium]|nr:diguanylate cyclase [Victivallales bacterium]
MLEGKKILVIDENKTDVEIIKLLLNNYDVKAKDRYPNVIRHIIQDKPDCILLACNKGDEKEFDLLNALKKDDFGRKIPVIMLSEYDSSGFAFDVIQNGASDYLVKGYFSKNNLVKSIFLAIERQKLVNTVYEQQKKLEKLSVMDELTGINNRRSLIEEIGKNIDISKRYKFPLSVAICDIDEFKSINDDFGHVVGDIVIKEIASVIKSRIRKVDIAGRHGGDEFVIVFPNTTVTNAARTSDSIRKKVLQACRNSDKFNQSKMFNDDEEEKVSPLNVTLSIGVADFTPYVNIADDLIARADEALYFAKKNGRNIVAFKSEDEDVLIFPKK